jgi:pyruvate/2-oxoglutarate/acetoin dehydrogenase E1 component
MPRKGKEMAVDTAEIQTSENGASANTEAAKRERVDPSTLDPMDKVTVVVTIPAAMKVAMIKAGEASNVVASAWARDVLAERLEFTIPPSFLEGARLSRFGSEEDRKAATAAKAKEQREIMKAALAAIKAGKLTREELGLS